MANKRLRSKALLAAPILMTAVFAPACEPRIYRNPGPPDQPPQTTPTSDPLADPPEGAEPGGRVEKQPDGTCLYVYPRPEMEPCPPEERCNPGPPRAPVPMK